MPPHDRSATAASDQAAGLRRILKRRAVRVLPVLGSGSDHWITALLAEALAKLGERVVLIDQGDGAAVRALGIDPRRSLGEVVAGACEFDEAVGVGAAGVHAGVAGDLFERLHAQGISAEAFFSAFAHTPEPSDLVVVRVTRPAAVARCLTAEGEILLATSTDAPAVCATYSNVKRTCARSHRYRIVVHGIGTAADAAAVHARMARAAERFLGIAPLFAGHIPAGPGEPYGRARTAAASALDRLAALALTWQLVEFPAHGRAHSAAPTAH